MAVLKQTSMYWSLSIGFSLWLRLDSAASISKFAWLLSVDGVVQEKERRISVQIEQNAAAAAYK